MPVVMMEAWKCAVCGWCWPKRGGMPSQCAATWCRSRGWNGAKESVKPSKHTPKPTSPPAKPAAPPPIAHVAPDPAHIQISSATYTRPTHAPNCSCYACKPPR